MELFNEEKWLSPSNRIVPETQARGRAKIEKTLDELYNQPVTRATKQIATSIPSGKLIEN